MAVNDNGPRILVLDIETKLIEVRTFGIRDQFIAHTQIRDIPGSARLIHCVGLKWLGERKVTVLTEWDHGYSGMMQGTLDMLNEADAVLGFNHENFDMKKLNGQFALEGLFLPKPPTNIDIFKTARRLGFPSSKLDYLSQAFGIGKKVKHAGFELWDKVLDGDPKAQRQMARYCAGDVRLTEELYYRLKPYIHNHPHLHDGGALQCGACGSQRTQSRGVRRTRASFIQRYQCMGCGAWFDGKRTKAA